MKAMLFKALDAADLVVCQGYEIDSDQVETCNAQVVRELCCGEDLIATVEDQTIEVDGEDGRAVVHDVQGESVEFVFKVYHPLEERDFLLKDLL